MHTAGGLFRTLVLLLCTSLLATPARAQQTVRVGVFDNKPIVFQTESGEMAGIAVDTLEDIARRQDWRLQYHYAPWNELLQALDTGQIDILVGIAYTPERAERYRFSTQTLVNNWGVVYQATGKNLSTISELAGQRVALMEKSVHSRRFDELMKGFGFDYTPVVVPHYSDVLLALQDGRADAGVINRIFSILNEDRFEAKPTSILFNPVQVRFAAPGQVDSPYLPVIDAYLGEAKSSSGSAYYKSLKRWLERTRDEPEVPAWLWPVIAVVGGVLIFSWLYVYLVQRQVRRRTSELADAESRFRQLANAVDAVFWIGSPDWGQFLYVSPGYQKIWGDDPRMLYQEPASWLLRVHEEDRVWLEQIIREKRNQIVSEYTFPDYRIRSRDGAVRWISARIYPVHDASGAVVRIAGIAQDVTEQKQTHLQLQQSQERLQTLVSRAQVVLFALDRDGVFTLSEGQALASLELQSGEVVGQSALTLYQAYPDTLEDIHRALRGEQFEVDRKIGDLYFETHYSPLYDAQGNLNGSMGVGVNITERVIARKQLESHQQKLELAMDAGDVGIWEWDMATDTVECSSRLETMFGLEKGTFCGRFDDFSGQVYPDDLDKFMAAVEKAVRQNRPFKIEYRILRSDGEVRWVYSQAQLRHDEHNRVTGMLGITSDLTEIKKAEQELRWREAQLAEAQRIAHLGSWELDMNSLKAAWSDEEFRLLGYAVDEVEASLQNFMAVVDPDDVEIVEQAIRRAVEMPQGNFDVEHRVRYADGTVRYMLEQGQVIFDEQGKPQSAIGTTLDITEQKLAQQELLKHKYHLEELVEERTAELQRINKELESFSYSVSHDLRAPLRAIDGFSQALYEDYQQKLDETAVDYLNRIRQAAGNMSNLIDSLLKLSRLTRSKFKREKVDLSLLAREVAEEQRQTHSGQAIEFIIEPQLSALGDAHMLKVMLTNLFNNAVKYSQSKTLSRIEFGARPGSSRRTVFYVADNGIGFDMRYADKLFGAFQRLHGNDDIEGMGIGLATVQRIVNRHGGRVWAEAVPGDGAVFYFVL